MKYICLISCTLLGITCECILHFHTSVLIRENVEVLPPKQYAGSHLT